MAECVYCRCEKMTSPAGDELAAGDPVICGQCGGLMVVDLDPEDPGAGIVRKPTAEESRELRKRKDVMAFLNAFDVSLLQELTGRRRGPQVVEPGTLRASGPDARH